MFFSISPPLAYSYPILQSYIQYSFSALAPFSLLLSTWHIQREKAGISAHAREEDNNKSTDKKNYIMHCSLLEGYKRIFLIDMGLFFRLLWRIFLYKLFSACFPRIGEKGIVLFFFKWIYFFMREWKFLLLEILSTENSFYWFACGCDSCSFISLSNCPAKQQQQLLRKKSILENSAEYG